MVLKTVLKTKHLAVVVTPCSYTQEASQVHSDRRKCCVYDLRAHNIDRLRYTLGTIDWSSVTQMHPVDMLYNRFLDVVRYCIHQCIPTNTITLRDKDPAYITPVIKSLLIKRNRLRRRGNTMQADSLAGKINQMIASVQNNRLSKLANSNCKEIWAAVRSCSSRSHLNSIYSSYSPDTVNDYFAAIATDDDYDISKILDLINNVTEDDFNAMTNNEITEPEVECFLRRLKNTAPGNDNIPCWLFKSCSYELAGVIAYIINYSLYSGTVPSSWLTSIVTPVLKT